jgi:hypothetical protein
MLDRDDIVGFFRQPVFSFGRFLCFILSHILIVSQDRHKNLASCAAVVYGMESGRYKKVPKAFIQTNNPHSGEFLESRQAFPKDVPR